MARIQSQDSRSTPVVALIAPSWHQQHIETVQWDRSKDPLLEFGMLRGIDSSQGCRGCTGKEAGCEPDNEKRLYVAKTGETLIRQRQKIKTPRAGE